MSDQSVNPTSEVPQPITAESEKTNSVAEAPEFVPTAAGQTNQPVVGTDEQDGDHEDLSVPTELLDLHTQLEESGVTPEEFKEVYGGVETGSEASLGGEATNSTNESGTQ